MLAGGDSGLAIWHFDGNEIYTLGGANPGSFDVVSDTGEVAIGNSPLLAGETYTFDLQLVGGESGAEVTATRAIEVIVDAAPLAPPPVINAPAGAVVVAANAGAASVTTFVLESGEGTFGEVAVGNLRTGGGDEAAVTLDCGGGDGGVCFGAASELLGGGRFDAVFDIDGDRGGRFGYGDDSIYFRAAGDRTRGGGSF